MELKSSSPRKIRIIGGHWRGRKISFPELPELRPTPDRVRETLFNWLRARIEGAHCLDLFAGSGALGLEAASRGAAHVILVDSNRRVCERLRKQIEPLETDAVEVVNQPAERFIENRARDCSTACDIVFLDPPFGGRLLQQTLDLLQRHPGVLAPHPRIYVESAVGRSFTPPATWQRQRKARAAGVEYFLYSVGEN